MAERIPRKLSSWELKCIAASIRGDWTTCLDLTRRVLLPLVDGRYNRQSARSLLPLSKLVCRPDPSARAKNRDRVRGAPAARKMGKFADVETSKSL